MIDVQPAGAEGVTGRFLVTCTNTTAYVCTATVTIHDTSGRLRTWIDPADPLSIPPDGSVPVRVLIAPHKNATVTTGEAFTVEFVALYSGFDGPYLTEARQQVYFRYQPQRADPLRVVVLGVGVAVLAAILIAWFILGGHHAVLPR